MADLKTRIASARLTAARAVNSELVGLYWDIGEAIRQSNRYKAGSFERSLAEGKSHNFAVALPGHLAEQAEEAPKSSYNLEFLGIQKQVKERELEDHLIARLRDFILELGYGFCFIGHQQSSSR